ncbi:MAG: hypothetical protein IH596_13955 [Bacteroidales bacterium]|nr:hypothetical protein [Bacteroidales bacterium]
MTICNNLIPYELDQPSRVILEFMEAVDAFELRYLSCDLLENLEMSDEHLLDSAIERAFNVCVALSIPTRQHFRRVFIIKQNGIHQGWKLSALGCYLTILNEDPSHPMVAQFQAFLF